ncbi:MAG: hypothetical protein ACW981_21005 [Candidatus Hodarchaeales archaeon]|jgi:hypothetical protein
MQILSSESLEILVLILPIILFIILFGGIVLRWVFSKLEWLESIKLFAPTSRTIGGPGNFTGECGQSYEIFKSDSEEKILCVTIENMGKCDLDVELRNYHTYSSTGTRATSTSVYVDIPGGASKTICGKKILVKDLNYSHGNVWVRCKSRKNKKDTDFCRYRWRVDVSEDT